MACSSDAGTSAPEPAATGSSQLSGADPWGGGWDIAGSMMAGPNLGFAGTAFPAVAILPPTLGQMYNGRFGGITADGALHLNFATAGVTLALSTAVSALKGEDDYHSGFGFGAGIHARLVTTAVSVSATEVAVTGTDGQAVTYTRAIKNNSLPHGGPSDGFYPPATQSGTWITQSDSCTLHLWSADSLTAFSRQPNSVAYYSDNTWFPQQVVAFNNEFAARDRTVSRVSKYNYVTTPGASLGQLESITEQLGEDGIPFTPTRSPSLQVTWAPGAVGEATLPVVTKLFAPIAGTYTSFAYDATVNSDSSNDPAAPILKAITEPSSADSSSGNDSVSTVFGYGYHGHFAGYLVTKTKVADGSMPTTRAVTDDNVIDGLALTLYDRTPSGSVARPNGAPVATLQTRTGQVYKLTSKAAGVIDIDVTGGGVDPNLDWVSVDFDGSNNVETVSIEKGTGHAMSYTWAASNGLQVLGSSTDEDNDGVTYGYDPNYGWPNVINSPRGTEMVNVLAADPLHVQTTVQLKGAASAVVVSDTLFDGAMDVASFRGADGVTYLPQKTSNGLPSGMQFLLPGSTTTLTAFTLSQFGLNICPRDMPTVRTNADGSRAIITGCASVSPDGNAAISAPISGSGDGYPAWRRTLTRLPGGPSVVTEATSGRRKLVVSRTSYQGAPLAWGALEGTTQMTSADTTIDAYGVLGQTVQKTYSSVAGGPIAPGTATLAPTTDGTGAAVAASEVLAGVGAVGAFATASSRTLIRGGGIVQTAVHVPNVTLPPVPTRASRDAGTDASGATDSGTDASPREGGLTCTFNGACTPGDIRNTAMTSSVIVDNSDPVCAGPFPFGPPVDNPGERYIKQTFEQDRCDGYPTELHWAHHVGYNCVRIRPPQNLLIAEAAWWGAGVCDSPYQGFLVDSFVSESHTVCTCTQAHPELFDVQMSGARASGTGYRCNVPPLPAVSPELGHGGFNDILFAGPDGNVTSGALLDKPCTVAPADGGVLDGGSDGGGDAGTNARCDPRKFACCATNGGLNPP